PAKGIREAFRVIKPGGIALMIGPLEPANPIGRFMAELWMLFPEEKAYWQWFREAGFEDLQVCYVKPQWAEGEGKYGIALAGRRPLHAADPPAPDQETEEEEGMGLGRQILLIFRVIIGSLAGFIFIPAALVGHLRLAFKKRDHIPEAQRERLNRQQITAIVLLAAIILLLFIIF
ncbi:MAG TPA: hypothetical protein VJ933_05935, partial [Phaeodactylibacter sp.]|nr:hypothetical protein [Phaeodactylibacter sp.]